MAHSFLTDLVEEQTELTASLQHATVHIQGQGRSGGTGAGVIWSADGLIITNAHVVTGAGALVQLADGRSLDAAVIARDRSRDLVALQLEATDLPAATIGDSNALRVGALVLAVGNPLGFTRALTTGIVHAINTTRQWIQADITLAPGNSGGLLANAQGQVIGINTMIVDGRGFAIPSHAVQRFLRDRHDRPKLGVSLQPVRVRLNHRAAFGLMITQIEPGSVAEAGQLQVGDVLVGMRKRLFQTANELFWVMENSHSGDGLSLDVLRNDRRLTVDLVLWQQNAANAA